VELSDVRLLVEDTNRARDFYRDVLGFELRVEAPDIYVEFKGGGVALGLYQSKLMRERIGERWVRGPGGTVLCIRVDDVDATFQDLIEKGATKVADPHDEPNWGLRVAHIADPDGHVIELDQLLVI
jgi:catechol 2,3-dioxygenase-like lactoylglutathione lyase family enzyme